ncbi:MAG: Asp-tRNA(Asn)/Glu-tRNA(Gln) amidotransferase subunit GatA [Elusimicrobiales bacterium]
MNSAFETAGLVKAGKTSAAETVRAALDAIAKLDGKPSPGSRLPGGIGAFLEVFEENALARAREIDKKRASGAPLGRLAGVPVALKDNILYAGQECSCGSRILAGHKAVYNATVVEKLLAQDAVIIGRTNMDEFAMGSSCENSSRQLTRNPSHPEFPARGTTGEKSAWLQKNLEKLDRVPGGSSGGSAAAVAAGMVPLALGSETGGSVRQPASLCGITGVKPTYGRVSRYGLVAFASSLDQISPFARDTRDAALILSVIAGHAPSDSTSAREEAPDYLAGLDGGVKGMKIGIAPEFFGAGLDGQTGALVKVAAEKLKTAGAELVEISLPHTKYAVAVYYILASSEASSNLARFDGMRYGLSAEGASLGEVFCKTRGEGFGPEVKRRIMLGTYALSAGYYDAYYGKAQKVRTLIARDYAEAFKKADLILTPTSPTPAFRFGEKTADPLQMYLSDIYTIPCNLAGLGGMSVPCGRVSSGWPAGAQLLCRHFDEARMFRAARTLEENAG